MFSTNQTYVSKQTPITEQRLPPAGNMQTPTAYISSTQAQMVPKVNIFPSADSPSQTTQSHLVARMPTASLLQRVVVPISQSMTSSTHITFAERLIPISYIKPVNLPVYVQTEAPITVKQEVPDQQLVVGAQVEVG